jgi:N-acetyl sugar amidotransferase
MDSSIPGISFDANGVCCFCTQFKLEAAHVLEPDPAKQAADLAALVKQIKDHGRGKPYDCVVGVSGGVDSSWVLVQAVQLGLRPLAVHMDNGWNSELAQNNIANLVRGLGVDLFTHVIDWQEYRGLMQSFFDADVIDVELLYDNAMYAVNYQQAARHGLRHLLSGLNRATEGMHMPPEWVWNKFDRRNILSIARRGGVRVRTFPSIGTISAGWGTLRHRIRWIWFLDLMPFRKSQALEYLQKNCGYKPYPYKHYESVFTRFYQGYILPRKFGVDKRIVHLSSLVMSGDMSRDDALKLIQGIPYPSQQALDDDIAYFLKKMNWKRADLDAYIARPQKPHAMYGSEVAVFKFAQRVFRSIKQ